MQNQKVGEKLYWEKLTPFPQKAKAHAELLFLCHYYLLYSLKHHINYIF